MKIKLPLLISFSMMLHACAYDVDYMAKYCVSSETNLYIMDDLTTFYVPTFYDDVSLERDDVEKGKIDRSEYDGYTKYTGAMNFIALKDPAVDPIVPGYDVKIEDGFYTVDTRVPDGKLWRYHIDFDGSLYQFDQILQTIGGDTVAFSSYLCGGRFQVN